MHIGLIPKYLLTKDKFVPEDVYFIRIHNLKNHNEYFHFLKTYNHDDFFSVALLDETDEKNLKIELINIDGTIINFEDKNTLDNFKTKIKTHSIKHIYDFQDGFFKIKNSIKMIYLQLFAQQSREINNNHEYEQLNKKIITENFSFDELKWLITSIKENYIKMQETIPENSDNIKNLLKIVHTLFCKIFVFNTDEAINFKEKIHRRVPKVSNEIYIDYKNSGKILEDHISIELNGKQEFFDRKTLLETDGIFINPKAGSSIAFNAIDPKYHSILVDFIECFNGELMQNSYPHLSKILQTKLDNLNNKYDEINKLKLLGALESLASSSLSVRRNYYAKIQTIEEIKNFKKEKLIKQFYFMCHYFYEKNISDTSFQNKIINTIYRANLNLFLDEIDKSEEQIINWINEIIGYTDLINFVNKSINVFSQQIVAGNTLPGLEKIKEKIDSYFLIHKNFFTKALNFNPVVYFNYTKREETREFLDSYYYDLMQKCQQKQKIILDNLKDNLEKDIHILNNDLSKEEELAEISAKDNNFEYPQQLSDLENRFALFKGYMAFKDYCNIDNNINILCKKITAIREKTSDLQLKENHSSVSPTTYNIKDNNHNTSKPPIQRNNETLTHLNQSQELTNNNFSDKKQTYFNNPNIKSLPFKTTQDIWQIITEYYKNNSRDKNSLLATCKKILQKENYSTIKKLSLGTLTVLIIAPAAFYIGIQIFGIASIFFPIGITILAAALGCLSIIGIYNMFTSNKENKALHTISNLTADSPNPT